MFIHRGNQHRTVTGQNSNLEPYIVYTDEEKGGGAGLNLVFQMSLNFKNDKNI
jgi:hypothetical protein